MRRWWWAAIALVLGCSSSKSDANSPSPDAGDDTTDTNPPEQPGPTPAWLSSAKRIVAGPDDTFADCRTVICRHNENTDLIAWHGAIWMIHRTAISQILGPNSALHVYQSTDDGATFTETARIDAPDGRDLRDPCFYVVNDVLHVKALTRLPVLSTRDSNVDTIAMEMHTTDGATWTPLTPIGPETQSFWRIHEHAGTYYTVAYQDGDVRDTLFASTDGVTWTQGAVVYDVAADTPGETEIAFMPSGKMLALVRMDGNDDEILGDSGRLRTKVCWADAPYATFTCPEELGGQRLDGPLAFFQNGRLFVIARKHLQGTGKKRTSLFELTGTLEGGPIAIQEWGEFPSAGDTAYAGIAMRSDGTGLVTWYSGRLDKDEVWALGMIGVTNIWQGFVDFSKLH
ncbi:MAG TPA: sialidase family protein [Labilithrix sp.]